MQGDFVPFKLFGVPHLSALALIVIGGFGFSFLARRSRSESQIQVFTIIVASVSVAGVVIRNVYRFWTDQLTLIYDLPMQLCDWAYIALWVAFLTRNQTAYELAYFWGLAGTLQSTITPVLGQGYPTVKFIQYFLLHGGIIMGVIYLTLGLRRRPRPGVLLRVFLWSQLFPLVVIPLNMYIGANYGFLMEKPDGPTLLDYFGPWPYYILIMEAAGVLSCCLYYSPFLVSDYLRARRASN